MYARAVQEHCQKAQYIEHLLNSSLVWCSFYNPAVAARKKPHI